MAAETPKKSRRTSAFESVDTCHICAQRYREDIYENVHRAPERRLAVTATCGHFMCGECFNKVKRRGICSICKVPLTEVRHLGETFYLKDKVSEMTSIHEQQVVKAKKDIENCENQLKNPWQQFSDIENYSNLTLSCIFSSHYSNYDLYKLTASDLHRYAGNNEYSAAVAREDLLPEGHRYPDKFSLHLYPQDSSITVKHSMIITGIKFNESEENMILTTSMDGTMSVVDKREDESVQLAELTEQVASEQFVCPLWDHSNEHLFLAGSTTGTVTIFDLRYLKKPANVLFAIQGMNFEMGEKSSIIGLYNYHSSKQSKRYYGSGSPKMVCVTQKGIDLLFEDSENFYTRHNVYSTDVNFIANSAFDPVTKSVLVVTHFPKMPDTEHHASYRYQLQQLPSWDHTMAQSVPRHNWYSRNLFSYARKKISYPFGESQYELKQYTRCNKVTLMQHPLGLPFGNSLLLAAVQNDSPVTIDYYRPNGNILPVFVNGELDQHDDCNSINSFSDNHKSGILLMGNTNWQLHALHSNSNYNYF
jgi:hypothetical protein